MQKLMDMVTAKLVTEGVVKACDKEWFAYAVQPHRCCCKSQSVHKCPKSSYAVCWGHCVYIQVDLWHSG